MPRYQVRVEHSIHIAADGRAVFDMARHGGFGDMPVVRRLFRLRGIPPSAASIDGLLELGFMLLSDQSGKEFVLGAVGKPWTRRGGLLPIASEEFATFDTGGYAKMAWNFAVERPPVSPVRLVTETRIRCTDAASRRKFAVYWALISPLARWIRREILRGIKERLERDVSFKETI